MSALKKFGMLVAALILSVAVSSPVWAGQKKYEGVTLRVMLPDGFTEAKAVSDLLLEAGKILGTEVKVSWYSSDELHDKALMDFTGGNKAWDILLVHSPDRGQWAEMGVIEPVGKFIADHPQVVDKAKLALNDYYEAHIRMYTHKGVWLGPPLYATGVATFYRTDLFTHPDEMKNFNAKYGYNLKEPATYKEFRDIAEFFTRKAGQTLAGKVLTSDFYGTSHSDKLVDYIWFDFWNYLMAFGADDIYDSKTMRPTINSPQAIAAGKFMVGLVPFMPPGHLNFTSGESTAVFAEGSVAMIIEYFIRGQDMVLNPEKSKVADKTAFTVLPSVPGVTGREHAAHMGSNFVALYGLSLNKEAAYKTIELGFSPEIMRKVYLEKYAPFGWIPPRPSVLSDPETQKRAPWMKAALAKLMDRKDVHYFEMAPLPEYFSAIDSITTALHKAMTGDTTVEQGFNQAQKEVEAIFKKAGYIK